MDNFKRQRTNIDKSTPELTYSDVVETQGSSFTLDEILQSTNTDNAESRQTSFAPSPREPQDPYDDPFDDLELDQYLESLTGPISIEPSAATLYLDDTDEYGLKQSDEDALVALLNEDT